MGLRWQHDGVWQNSHCSAGPNRGYPFSVLYPQGSIIYSEVPAPGYAARAVVVDRNIIKTNAVPLRVSVEVPYQSINLVEEIRDPRDDRVEIRDGMRAIPVPDHPSLGRVAIVEEYRGTDSPQRVTLIRLLPDSQPLEGTASFTIGDFSYPVLEVSWRSESRSEGGATLENHPNTALVLPELQQKGLVLRHSPSCASEGSREAVTKPLCLEKLPHKASEGAHS